MLKKFFRSLTKSKSEIYLEDLEQAAANLQSRGTPQLAATLRHFISLKRELEQRIASKDTTLLPVENLGSLTTAVCDGVLGRIEQLAKLQAELPKVLTSRDHQRYSQHMDNWRTQNEALLSAFSLLHRVHTGTGPSDAPQASSPAADNSPLQEAMANLLLEVRTAERIRDEL